MGVGNQGGGGNSGNKRSNHNYEHRNLQTAGSILAALGLLATEATLISVLNAIVAHQDMEILLVRDTGNGDLVVQQIREYDETTGTWSTSYEDVNGNAYVPVGPLQYLDPSAILNLILAELLDQGLTLDNIETNTNDVATETTLSTLLAAFNAEDFASETTLAALLLAFNTEDFATEATLNSLLTAFNAEDFATETTLALVNSNVVLGNITLNSLLTAFNAEDFATETTLALMQALLTTIDADTSNLDVALSTRASEATLLAAATDLAAIEVLLTPAARVSNTISVTVAGNVPAGSMSGSVFNAGNQPGTWNGVTIPAGVSIPWGPIGNRDTYGAIAYDPTSPGAGTTFIIEYTT